MFIVWKMSRFVLDACPIAILAGYVKSGMIDVGMMESGKHSWGVKTRRQKELGFHVRYHDFARALPLEFSPNQNQTLAPQWKSAANRLKMIYRYQSPSRDTNCRFFVAWLKYSSITTFTSLQLPEEKMPTIVSQVAFCSTMTSLNCYGLWLEV